MKFPSRIAVALTLAMAAGPLFAATATPAAKPMSPQQQRMAQCSAQNKGKTGADYKAAQSACLSGKATPVASMTAQQRMAKCSAENKGKKGADYQAAQSACLKAH